MADWWWLWWLGGFLAGGSGGALVFLGLLGDRLQGGYLRRRCPKCSYDMSAVKGLKCPECGREARREKRLFRSRRRKGIVVAGLLLMIGGLAASAWPHMTGEQWFKHSPGPVRGLTWSYVLQTEPGVEFIVQMEGGQCSWLTRRAAAWRAARVLRAPAAETWSVLIALRMLAQCEGAGAEHAAPEVTACLQHNYAPLRVAAARAGAAAGVDRDLLIGTLESVIRAEPGGDAANEAATVLKGLVESQPEGAGGGEGKEQK